MLGAPVALVLAHQGGWDEILFVLLPIALFAGLLALANKRAARLQAERRGGERSGDDGPPPG
ncbi:MAG: hypothetical protein AB7L84_02880 [Acidimicrobiia bacterium]